MFSFLSNFKHGQEMRESKDEILVGEIVRAIIFKVPMLGDVRLDHQLNSILATKKSLIDIDAYILKGEESAQQLSQLLNGVIGELRQKLAPYKKA